MRKVFALIVMATFAIVSCQKGLDPAAEEKDNDLVGTKWVTPDFARQIIRGGNPMMTYEFTDNTHLDVYTTDDNTVVNFDETTTYDYNYPKLVIHEHNTDGVDCKYEYEFKDKFTIVRVGQNEYSPYMKFTKLIQ